MLQQDFSRTRGHRTFLHVAMDLLEPLPPTSSNNRYIFVVQDTFIKYVEFYQVDSADAPTVVDTYSMVVIEYLTRWTITVALGQIDTETIGRALLFEVVLSSGPKASSLQTTDTT